MSNPEVVEAVNQFLAADKEYNEVLADLEQENPEGFNVLWAALEERNVAVRKARDAIKKCQTNVPPFTVQVRKEFRADTAAFVKLAKSLGLYDSLTDSGALVHKVDIKKMELAGLDEANKKKLLEAGEWVVSQVAVYGPKERESLK
jgi:hypothetical protein